jgi:hypothetical protein
MKPWDKVSSFRGANTLFQGQQNKDTQRRRQITEERSKERPETQIKDDPRIRAEEPGPLRDTASEGPSTLQKEIAVTTSEVVINRVTNRKASSVTQHVTYWCSEVISNVNT